MIKNEFQTMQEQQDLEALKDFVPSWQNAKVEPFLHDVPVIPPTWNKVKLDQNLFSSTTDGGGTPQPGSTKVIVGVQSGSTFIVQIMTPVQGTLFENV